jgi:polar amino acid transport system substrate-binding protein
VPAYSTPCSFPFKDVDDMKTGFSILSSCRVIVMLIAVTLSGIVTAVEHPLTMLVSSDNAPKMFVNAEGKPVGYFTELADAAGRRAGYKITIIAVPWARALQMAERGEGVICSLSKTPERELIYAYSDPVLVDRVLIVTMKQRNIVAASLADLKGMAVGVNRGSKYGTKFVEELPLVHVDEDNSGESRLRKLALGRIDAAVISGGMAAVRFNAKLAGVDMNDLTVQKTPLALDKNYFAMSRSRPDMEEVLSRLNQAIAAMLADGSLDAIMDTWGGMR